MKVLFKCFMTAAVAVALSLTINDPASAGPLTVTITDSLGHQLVESTAGPNSSITISNVALVAAFPELSTEPGVAFSSSSTGNPDTILTTQATLKEATLKNAVPVTFTIVTSETGFINPDPAKLTTSASFNFLKEAQGTTASFQGGVDTLNLLNQQNVVDTMITATSTGPGPNTGNPTNGGMGLGTMFNNGNDPYSITNVLVIHLQPGGQVQGQGVTDIAATPEPSTLVLACLAGVPFAIARFRRWGRKDAAQKPFTV